MILNYITYVNKTYVHEHVMYITLCKYYKNVNSRTINYLARRNLSVRGSTETEALGRVDLNNELSVLQFTLFCYVYMRQINPSMTLFESKALYCQGD